MPNRDAEFMNVIDISDPENASIIIKWPDHEITDGVDIDCT